MTKLNKNNNTIDPARNRTNYQFRCLHCFKRVTPPKGAKVYTCPHCNYSWRISWFNSNEPRIRGPVWATD